MADLTNIFMSFVSGRMCAVGNEVAPGGKGQSSASEAWHKHGMDVAGFGLASQIAYGVEVPYSLRDALRDLIID